LIKHTQFYISYELEMQIKLNPGINKLYIEITNSIETVRSDTVTINYAGEDTINRLALVIGNGNYNVYPLKYPSHDALLLSKTLQKHNFEVIELIDGSKQKMIDTLQKFIEKLTESKGVGLLYYSGRGIMFNGENYLLPVDYKITKETDFENEGINLNDILEKMKISGAFLKIVIIDKCHLRPNDLKDFNISPYYSIPNLYIDNLIISFSHAAGLCDCERPCTYSLYNQELIKAIGEKRFNIEDVFKQVRRNVMLLTQQKQIPWENISFEGEFYFNE